MKLNIYNGNVVTGDGETVLEKSSVTVEGALISAIQRTPYITYDDADRLVDAEDGYIIPGIINAHTHGATLGPFNVFGSPELPWGRLMRNLDRHLQQGETTLLVVDGLNTVWETEIVNTRHPINMKTATAHLPSVKKLAQLVDGTGLKERHMKATVEEMLNLGAVAIGEVGAIGLPLGISEVERRAGRRISIQDYRKIQAALFQNDKGYTPKKLEPKRVGEALKKISLDGVLKVEEMPGLVDEILSQVKLGIKGIEEAVRTGKRLGVPVIAHNDPENQKDLLKLAEKFGSCMIAAHCNHLFQPDEAVKQAQGLKKAGALLDVYAGDYYGARQMATSPEATFRLMERGLVDLISTDYIAGYWDPILLVLEK
ncbi:MAG: hypothetical protein JSW01_03555, partial [Candidatus Bathyarchaeota archaeon]